VSSPPPCSATRRSTWPLTPAARREYALSEKQLSFYEDNGFLEGVRVLNDAQVERLREELQPLFDPTDPRNKLFHEYNENEAEGTGFSLFHSLGAWRITPAFHDVLFHPRYLVPSQQLMKCVKGWKHAWDCCGWPAAARTPAVTTRVPTVALCAILATHGDLDTGARICISGTISSSASRQRTAPSSRGTRCANGSARVVRQSVGRPRYRNLILFLLAHSTAN
jgi:hypothetical protein